MRSPTLAPASLIALTSFSAPPPTAWQDPLDVHPSQELDGKARTHVPVESSFMTMPCSVATRVFLSVHLTYFCAFLTIISGSGSGKERGRDCGVRGAGCALRKFLNYQKLTLELLPAASEQKRAGYNLKRLDSVRNSF
jgi:hypothetical protein